MGYMWQVELTARRTLSFLSGGDLVPLLGDILYPSEKELLAERWAPSTSAGTGWPSTGLARW